MNIAGFIKNSFVDYPGKIAAVVFTQGCNMNCYYCHNSHLIPEDGIGDCDSGAIIDLLKPRRKMLDGVVISGGEPTLQPGLEDFIKSVKGLGLEVKLDTNGTNPGLLSRFIDMDMLDYLAMDIKAPIDKYEDICGKFISIDNIERSIDILLKGKVKYEFRTTLVPELSEDDVISIAARITGAEKYVLQAYREPLHLIKADKTSNINYEITAIPGCKVYSILHSDDFIIQMAEKAGVYVKKCETRGLNK